MATNPGSSAPSSYTVNYDALLSTTLFKYRPTMQDNIFKSNAFLAALREYGGIDKQGGGERVKCPLMYEENDTFASYRGYDTLQVIPQDGMTSAFYEWTEIGGTITISRREKRQNSGEEQILNLLKKKTMQAEMSIKSKVNNQLVAGTIDTSTFVPGNEAKDLLPIGYFLPKANATDPVAGGNVGNISRASYSWWRPHTAVFDSGTKDTGNSFALSVSTYAGLKVALYRMWNYCSRGADGSGPNIVLSDQVTYETYENALDQSKRYGDEKLAAMGFDSVKLKGAYMIWDELVPDVDQGLAAGDSSFTGTAFFINTRFYKLIIDSETDFVTTPFIEPENQTASTAKVLFMGQASVDNMRKLGVCYAIAQNIVA